MTRRCRNPRIALTLALALATGLPPLQGAALAAPGGGRLRTTGKMLYHDGSVMQGHTNVYFIFYGCWDGWTGSCPPGYGDWTTASLLQHLIVGLNGSPYMQINTTYPDFTGGAPNGGLLLGLSVGNAYSHGSSLSETDVQEVVLDAVLSRQLPWDTRAVYIVATSWDVTVEGFCTNVAESHGAFTYDGTRFAYAWVGNPRRCPLAAAPHFTAPNGSLLPTPNDDFAGDAMATSIAHVLSGTITNVDGLGWFDRYGLENSDKCRGLFGPTYTTDNGAEANIELNGRDYLIQKNWVNATRGTCALSYP